MIALLAGVFAAFHAQLLASLMQIYKKGMYVVMGNLCFYVLMIIGFFWVTGTANLSLNPETGIFGFLNEE